MSGTALVAVGELEKMAQAVAASKLFGVTNAEQALALMLVAQAEGLHPATAARDYHIIQGRPTLKADAMLARYLHSGGKVEWHEHTDQKVSATFTHPQGGSLKIDWDDARVKAAGLGGNPMHAKYPRQMKRARVISEGIRATNPAVAIGLYTPEEAQDFEPAPRKRGDKAKDMGDAVIVQPEPSTSVLDLSALPPVAERSKELHDLASKTKYTVRRILTQLGYAMDKDVPDMSDEDYAEAVAYLKGKAGK